MRKLKVLIVEQNKGPYTKEINDTLEALQEVVGGYIEKVTLEYNVQLICNEDGKFSNLEPNRRIGNDNIVGTFFIVGQRGEQFASLNGKQIQKYKEIFKLSNDK